MPSLNLGQDVANKRERKKRVAHIVAKPYPLYLAVRMHLYGSLIKINPSAVVMPESSSLDNHWLAHLSYEWNNSSALSTILP